MVIIKIPKAFMKDYNKHDFELPIILEDNSWRWYIGDDVDKGNNREINTASPLMRIFFEMRDKPIMELINEK